LLKWVTFLKNNGYKYINIKILEIMKELLNFRKISLLSIATVSFLNFFTNCNSDDNNSEPTNQVKIPTAQEFALAKQKVLENNTQTFQITADGSVKTITTAAGTKLEFDTDCLRDINGNSISGNVEFKVIEVYDGARMAMGNIPSMGIVSAGVKSLLVSGGEFFIEANKNGQVLNLACGINLKVPVALTGGAQTGMSLWKGTKDANADNFTWDNKRANNGTGGDVQVKPQTNEYNAIIQEFGWTNIDKFYYYNGAKTLIKATAPDGFDFSNSAIYLHYDGEGSALAKLDVFANGVFSEHYGQIPIGKNCHLIFMSVDNAQWRYAIKPITISANAVYSFAISDTQLGSDTQLKSAINGLP
jgi:hypothetical protein